MTRLRWGIVGTGGISRMTAGDLHLTENLDLVAVASRTVANAEAFAAEFEVPRWHGSYDDLFADEDVDVVYIGTPIGTHFEVARRALLAGKHVLLEKAFTTTAAEARELAALAAQQGRFLMEAMWMRFNPAIQRVLEELAEGAVGHLVEHPLKRRVEAHPHRLHEKAALLGGEGGEVSRLVGGGGERLLHQDVLAGEQRPARQLGVRGDRRADVDDVDVLVGEQRVVVAVGPRHAELVGERRGVVDRP